MQAEKYFIKILNYIALTHKYDLKEDITVIVG